MLKPRLISVLAGVAMASLAAMAAADEPRRTAGLLQYGQPKRLGEVADSRIRESSGLAASRRDPGALWTHNDSGDRPRLFLIDTKGQTLASPEIEGAEAVDWEDMASFERDGQHFLLVGDVGDNPLNRGSKRAGAKLYLVEEPRIAEPQASGQPRLRAIATLEFTYDDGPKNCEAIAVDAAANKVYLVSKQWPAPAGVYELALSGATASRPATARQVARLKMPAITAMDISPDGLCAVLLTYGEAYVYTRGAGQTWAQAFAGTPQLVGIPRQAQAEAICFGADGRTLYLSSEGVRQPLWTIPVLGDSLPNRESLPR